MTLNEKILLALSELLIGGERNITGYKIAKVANVERTLVYRKLKQIKEKGNSNGIN